MQRFEFRLERVLKVKQQRERLAEMRQKQARVALDAARADVAALNDQIARNAAEYEARLGRGGAADGLLGLWQQSARFADQMSFLEARVHQAAAHYQAASAARAQIATEVEALLGLRRQKWEEHRLLAQRAQQEQLDDVGMRRWRAGRRDSSPEL